VAAGAGVVRTDDDEECHSAVPLTGAISLHSAVCSQCRLTHSAVSLTVPRA
jgi:hypothetical protein